MSFSFPIDPFFNTGTELDATLTTVASGSSSIKVHFWNEYEAMRIAELNYDSTAPLCRMKTSELDGAVQNDRILISTVNYYIIDIQSDGLGITLLTLSKEAV